MNDKKMTQNSNNITSVLAEDNFDLLLQDEFSKLIPNDEIINSVTPWKKYIRFVLWGLFFSAMNNNIIYITLTGLLFTILGFRGLRKENNYFFIAYIITFIRLFIESLQFLINTSIHHNTILTQQVYDIIFVIYIILVFATYICLWLAIRNVETKAGILKHSHSPYILIIWYALVYTIFISGPQADLVEWIFLISYIGIFACLFKIFKSLDVSGYAITPAQIKTPNVAFAGVIIACICIILSIILLNNHYPMKWILDKETDTSEVTLAKSHLSDLCVPEHVLNDLSNDELIELSKASVAVVFESDKPINEGREATENGVVTTVYDVYELHFTNIAFRMSDDGRHWRTIHHFSWNVNPHFFGTEAMKIGGDEIYNIVGDVSGRLLCRKGNDSYISSYHNLEYVTATEYFFENSYESSKIEATFSFDKKADSYSGYIIFDSVDDYELINKDYYEEFYSEIYYYHQAQPFIYPAQSSQDFLDMNYFMYGGNDYKIVRDHFGFAPLDYSPKDTEIE